MPHGRNYNESLDPDDLIRSLNEEKKPVPQPEKPTTPEPMPQAEEPVSQDRKKVPGKEKKEKVAAAAKREKKKPAGNVPKKMMGIYFPEDTHRKLKMAALQQDVYLTDMISSLCEDALLYTYRCNEASCGMDFVLRSSIAGPAPAPKCCPFCGSSRTSHCKY